MIQEHLIEVDFKAKCDMSKNIVLVALAGSIWSCGTKPTPASTCGTQTCATNEVCIQEKCLPKGSVYNPTLCKAGAPSWTSASDSKIFEEVLPENSGLLGALGNRLMVSDYNNDGWPDLLIVSSTNAYPNPMNKGVWLFKNDKGRFVEETDASMITRGREGARSMNLAIWADVDNDGDEDLFSGVIRGEGPERSEILLNNGQGVFELGPEGELVTSSSKVRVPLGASFVDVDHDGNVDLWVGENQSRQDRLFKGDGAGDFVDITEDVGLRTKAWSNVADLNQGLAHSNSWGTAACDLNGDGWSELLSASYGRAPNHLWLAANMLNEEGLPSFTNRSVASGYAYDDNQEWKNNYFARCFCTLNPTAEECTTVTAIPGGCDPSEAMNWNHGNDRQPFRLGGNSATTVCVDLDNDGDMDLLTNEIRHAWAGSGADGSQVLLNQGDEDIEFDRQNDADIGLNIAGHTPGQGNWDEGHLNACVIDVDNDGLLDIYQGDTDYPGTRGHLYHHEAGMNFREVPGTWGIVHNRSHGVVAIDIDQDGDQDLILGHSLARCSAGECYSTSQVRVFRNIIGQNSNWLQIELKGKAGTNRSAIGARVRVTADTVTQTQEVSGGHGLGAMQNERVLHFGVSGACLLKVEVRWPNAALDTETFWVSAGSRYLIEQGKDPIAVKPE